MSGAGGKLAGTEGRALAENAQTKKKTCPQCGQETFDFLKACPSCGFAWPDLELLRTRRAPGRRLAIILTILVSVLLGSFCVLYLLLESFSGRGAH